ncbi:hypothetical protein VP01_4932g1 [Puccinia sorghi]|uniref:Uncharacterized protein n=1 Tax=Puccinia sorghi TaxID=27349 RepID=A0A0L6UM08_9BASI|nr:hypothetical protein VP01_4932g1 [Puccinia sorghi]
MHRNVTHQGKILSASLSSSIAYILDIFCLKHVACWLHVTHIYTANIMLKNCGTDRSTLLPLGDSPPNTSWELSYTDCNEQTKLGKAIKQFHKTLNQRDTLSPNNLYLLTVPTFQHCQAEDLTSQTTRLGQVNVCAYIEIDRNYCKHTLADEILKKKTLGTASFIPGRYISQSSPINRLMLRVIWIGFVSTFETQKPLWEFGDKLKHEYRRSQTNLGHQRRSQGHYSSPEAWNSSATTRTRGNRSVVLPLSPSKTIKPLKHNSKSQTCSTSWIKPWLGTLPPPIVYLKMKNMMKMYSIHMERHSFPRSPPVWPPFYSHSDHSSGLGSCPLSVPKAHLPAFFHCRGGKMFHSPSMQFCLFVHKSSLILLFILSLKQSCLIIQVQILFSLFFCG